MRVLISGATGFLGNALISKWRQTEFDVSCLIRDVPVNGFSNIKWNPYKQTVNKSELEGFDVIIHLVGESIAKGRWTRAKKERLLASRIESTKFLVNSLKDLTHKPKTFICASAIGIYGDRGEDFLEETDSPGSGFLPQLGIEWEKEAGKLASHNIRAINARFGLILGASGGILKSLLLPFRLGLGGRIGSGKQYMSWISVTDCVRAIEFIFSRPQLHGPVNVVSPYPITNDEFSRALASVLKRPYLFHIPAAIVKLVFGEMGNALLLGSSRVVPRKLLDESFNFHHPYIIDALRAELKA